MESPTSCVSTASSSDEGFEHNIWNSFMELPFHVQIGGIFELFADEIDLARTALSCHFAVDLLCDKEGPTIPHDAQAGTTACCQHPLWYGIIQDYAGGYAAPASVVEKSRQCLASLLRPWMSTWRLRQRCSQHLHQL